MSPSPSLEPERRRDGGAKSKDLARKSPRDSSASPPTSAVSPSGSAAAAGGGAGGGGGGRGREEEGHEDNAREAGSGGDDDDDESEAAPPPLPSSADTGGAPKLKAKAVRELRARFKLRLKTIRTVDADWKLRVNAMNDLEEMIRVGDVVYLASWDVLLAHLRTALAAQLADLRSNIVREACSLLVGTAARVGNTYGFDEVLRGLLPSLLRNLYVTTKAIADRSNETALRVLELSNAACAVRDIAEWATTDNHSDVRARCADYLALIVRKEPEEGYDTVEGERLDAAIGVVRTNASHADPRVRSATRKLYRALRDAFPDEAASLLASLPAVQQRYLENQKAGGSGTISASSSGSRVNSGKFKRRGKSAGRGKRKKKSSRM